jgi:C_GCAxxG_C_C family probable redox protein
MGTNRTRGSDRTSIEPERRRFLATACCLGPTLALAAYLPSARRDEPAPSASILSTEERIDLALTRFKQGFHCSQSVLEAYAGDFGIKPELARRLAVGLAGGSTVGGECGTVGSGYLVLGLRHGSVAPSYGDTEREEELWGRVRRFAAEFKKRHGTLACRELLGVDAFTREGREEALRKNLFVTRCHGFIRDAITILESLG